MDVYLAYLLPLLATLWAYVRVRRARERRDAARLDEAVRAGLTEPASLHPVFDDTRCCGSAACVRACPEGALGIVGGKARLVNAAACIGHGACQAACPVNAITLVFGTARRGMDIPRVSPRFETNVPGLYIAGELGGMGLIRKAAEQGRQAMASIHERVRRLPGDSLDVVIVGAGPAGIAAALGAKEKRLRHALVEQEAGLGGSVYHYPRHKIAMTAPVTLPLVGRVRFGEVSKEALLAFWEKIVADTGLEVSFGERMEALAARGDGFEVKTTRRVLRAKAVLLAVGRRGTPRKLGVPGEELPKVVYRLVDAEQYRGMRVLVVGGGDSALEAALAVAGQPGTEVTLSYRSEAFSRVKEANRARLEQSRAAGRIAVLLSSNVRRIGAADVALEQQGREVALANDAVIVQAGGVLPSDFLRSVGVEVETKYGTA